MRRSPDGPLARTFRSLGSRNFRLYFTGQAVSVSGMWMQTVALSWLVLRITGSGVALGVEMALTFGPILLVGVWGGVVADRFDKRRVLIGTQSGFAVLALVLGALTATGVITLWMVYTLSVLTGLVTAVDNPTRHSFVMDMVGRQAVANAVSLSSAVFTGTRIIGPALAGVLIGIVGLAPVFFFNAVSYLAVIVALALMRPGELHLERSGERRGGGLGEGLRYVWRTPDLRLPLLLMGTVFTFSFNFAVLLPLMAERAFGGGARTFGALMSVMGVGAFAGALLLASHARPSLRLLAAAAIGLGALSVAAAAAPSLWWELPTLVPVGAAGITFMITGNTTLQLTSVAAMRGRVMALYTVVFMGGTPIGAPLAGWVSEHLGPRLGLGLGGGVAALAGFLVLAKAGTAPRSSRSSRRPR